MKIIIVGMPYFASKLKLQFEKYDLNNTYIFLDTFYKKKDKLKYIYHITNADLLYMIGGGVNNSKTIDIALLLKKTIVLHWSGTDVLKAAEEILSNRHNPKYINKIIHLCEVDWIKEELLELGIQAKILPRTTFETPRHYQINRSTELKVLLYINKARPLFYGIDNLIYLAKDFPHVEFRVAGIDDYPDIPSNIQLLGWLKSMNKEYEYCSVYIRMPKHDGIAYSVIEALGYGKIVLRNKKFPFCQDFNSYPDLKQKFESIVMKFHQKYIPPNLLAIDFITSEFNEENVINNLVLELTNASKIVM